MKIMQNDSNSAAMTQIYGKDPVSGLIEMVKKWHVK